MLHIIQNDPEVPPGSISDHLPIPYCVHHPYRDGKLPQLKDISALIVLGGAMGANDDRKHLFLADLKQLIRQVVESGLPYLGVCLGGQLLAAALGAQVVSNRWEEIGNYHVSLTEAGAGDCLLQGLPLQFPVFQWHHDSFELPRKGVLLAASPACPHQAFRVGKSAWGVQFHPEVTEEIIRCWSAWDSSLTARTEEFVAGFNAEAASYAATVSRLLTNFLVAAKLQQSSV